MEYKKLFEFCKEKNYEKIYKLFKLVKIITDFQTNGITPLYYSSEQGYCSICELLLANGADPNSQNIEEKTPLHAACLGEQEHIVDLLLKFGADPHKIDIHGVSPIDFCKSSSYWNILRLLDPDYENIPQEDSKIRKQKQEEIFKEIISNNVSAIRKMIKNKEMRRLMHKQDSINGITPLIAAVQTEGKEIVKTLIEIGVNLNQETTDGQLAIFEALKLKKTAIAELLITNGSKMDLMGNEGDFPLHTAIKLDKYKLIKLMVEHGADPTKQNRDGLTPIHICVEKKSTKMLELLHNLKAKMGVQDSKRRTALMYHIQRWIQRMETQGRNAKEEQHDQAIMKWLVDHVDPNIPDEDNSTVLHALVKSAQTSILSDFLRAVKQAHKHVKIESWNEIPLLHLAVLYSGGVDMIELLMSHNVSAEQRDIDGNDLLHVAVKKSNIDVIRYCIEKLQLDPLRVNENKDTTLHSAMEKGDPVVLAELVKYHTDVNKANKSGILPIHLAAARGYMLCLQYLLDLGASINAVTQDKQTPLELALANGHRKTAALLVERGAPSRLHFLIAINRENLIKECLDAGFYGEIFDHNCVSALHFAVQKANPNIVDLVAKSCFSVDFNYVRSQEIMRNAIADIFNTLKTAVEFSDKTEILMTQPQAGIYTPLQYAAELGNIEICRVLLDNQARIIDFPPCENPYEIAERAGHEDCARFLQGEFKRRTAAQELLDTEIKYQKILFALLQFIVMPVNSRRLISKTEMSRIFLNLDRLYASSVHFLKLLKQDISAWKITTGIGTAVSALPNLLHPYKEYTVELSSALEFLQEKMNTVPPFANVVEAGLKDPDFRSLDIRSVLQQPMSRMAQYSLLLKACLKRTSSAHSDHQPLLDALEKVMNFNSRVNTEKHTHDARSTLEKIDSEMSCFGLSPSHLRELVFKDQLFVSILPSSKISHLHDTISCVDNPFLGLSFQSPISFDEPFPFLSANFDLINSLTNTPSQSKVIMVFNDILLICSLVDSQISIEFSFPIPSVFVDILPPNDAQQLFPNLKPHKYSFKLITPIAIFLISSDHMSACPQLIIKETTKFQDFFVLSSRYSEEKYFREISSRFTNQKHFSHSRKALRIDTEDLLLNFNPKDSLNLDDELQLYQVICFVRLDDTVLKLKFISINSSSFRLQKDIAIQLSVIFDSTIPKENYRIIMRPFDILGSGLEILDLQNY
ncbi:ankyrin repeat and socs box protein [Anaeramoeba ignava]|uniref:Ankyrin repeat and socs box protein n=1 Tax=Anaeramoeba ignava TaxID=1746090 RepID=A0A9Q0R6E9_ANAIG|nr:ankyrin repeat and socs box protein [Anaeramoeba ignava]